MSAVSELRRGLQEVDRLDVARFLVDAGDRFATMLRETLIVFSAVMVTMIAAVVLGEQARKGALTPEEIESVGLALQAAAYIALGYPPVRVLAWFGRQFVEWYDGIASDEVVDDA